jgi:hypothetical protein
VTRNKIAATSAATEDEAAEEVMAEAKKQTMITDAGRPVGDN